MRRRAFDLLVGASLLLFLTVLVFWIRSYHILDRPTFFTVERVDGLWNLRIYSLTSCKGRLIMESGATDGMTETNPFAVIRPFVWSSWPVGHENPTGDTGLYRLGFAYHPIIDSNTGRIFAWDLMLPYWALAFIFAILPAWLQRKRRLRRNNRRGFEVSSQFER